MNYNTLKRFWFIIRTGILSILLIIFISCGRQHNFKVTGSFKKPASSKILLFYLGEEKSLLIDSVLIEESDEFVLKGKVDVPSIYLIKFFNAQTIYLVVKPGDKVLLDIDNSKPEISYYVEGSYDSKLIRQLISKQDYVLKEIDQLTKEWEKSEGDTLLRRRIDKYYTNLLNEHRKFTREFIYDHPKSLANILALYQNFGRKAQPLFDRYDDLELFSFVDSNLIALFPESEPVQVLNREVTKIKEQMTHNAYPDRTVSEGSTLPELDAVSIQGDTVKIIKQGNTCSILFFWASWNDFSVDELKSLEQLFREYKNTDLKFVTISLDRSKKKLQDFLQKNKINMPVICDYLYWESEYVAQYSVKKIPATFLISKENKVIAKDLLAEDLEIKIKELLKNRE